MSEVLLVFWVAAGAIANTAYGMKIAQGEYDRLWWTALAFTSLGAIVAGPFTALLFLARK